MVRDRVTELSKALHIDETLDRRPGTLSGGQRQRVAMGRADSAPAEALPDGRALSNLDAGMRTELRMEISSLVRALGVTTVYVTHDQIEALTLADRIAIMNRGVLQDIGTPAQVYNDPATAFTAAFLSSQQLNLLAATVRTPAEPVHPAGLRHAPDHDPLDRSTRLRCVTAHRQPDHRGHPPRRPARRCPTARRARCSWAGCAPSNITATSGWPTSRPGSRRCTCPSPPDPRFALANGANGHGKARSMMRRLFNSDIEADETLGPAARPQRAQLAPAGRPDRPAGRPAVVARGRARPGGRRRVAADVVHAHGRAHRPTPQMDERRRRVNGPPRRGRARGDDVLPAG